MYNTQYIMQAQSSSDTDNKTDSDTKSTIITELIKVNIFCLKK